MITSLEDQILETVKQGQEAVVKAVRTWADASKNLIPDLPPLPFADQLPDTSEIVENVFSFVDKLLASQREFAGALLDATKPVYGATDKAVKSGPAKPAGPAAKTSAAA
jgi:cysteinyl-tRNA synthetase